MSFRAAYRALPTPILLGHRGLNTVATENTLAAIEQAARAGADGVEIDVRPCGSGELVVMHDLTLARLTSGADERAVACLSLAQLGRVRLAGEATIPTLAQVLECSAELGLCLNIEMKRDVPSRLGVVLRTARALERHRGDHALVVSCFDPVMLAAFRALAPSIPSALLIAPRHLYLHRLAPPLGNVAVHLDRRLVSAKLLRHHHARGLLVLAWTVNRLSEAKHLLSAGVDGLITDDPAALRPLVDAAR